MLIHYTSEDWRTYPRAAFSQGMGMAPTYVKGNMERQESAMGTWIDPARMVWHTVACTRCQRTITRIKLPGIVRSTAYRLCSKCTTEAAGAKKTPQKERGSVRRPSSRIQKP
jgi:hypothetical protein